MQVSRTKFRKSFVLSTKKWIEWIPGKNPVNSKEKSGDITTINHQPSTFNPQPSTLSPQPSTLKSQLSTLNPQPSSLSPQPSTLNPQPSTSNPRPPTLNHQLSILNSIAALEHSILNLNTPFSSCLKRLIPQPSTLNCNSSSSTFLKPQTFTPAYQSWLWKSSAFNSQEPESSKFAPQPLTINLNHQPSTLDHQREPSTLNSQESHQSAQ